MLLQDNKVRAYICSGIIAERIVRQTQGCNKISLFYQLHSDEWNGSVHHALRRNKGYQTAFPHLVETFEEEVIVQGLCRLTVADLLAYGISRVCNRKISERNIGCSHVEISVEIGVNFLKTLYAGQYRGVQRRQYFAGEQILFVCQNLGTGVLVIP